jgi:hypothetical protein
MLKKTAKMIKNGAADHDFTLTVCPVENKIQFKQSVEGL